MWIAYCWFISNLWDIWNSAVEKQERFGCLCRKLSYVLGMSFRLYWLKKAFFIIIGRGKIRSLFILFNQNKARSFFAIRLYSHNNSCTRPKLQQASCERRSSKENRPLVDEMLKALLHRQQLGTCLNVHQLGTLVGNNWKCLVGVNPEANWKAVGSTWCKLSEVTHSHVHKRVMSLHFYWIDWKASLGAV